MRLAASATCTFIPPASPAPGLSSGEVCRQTRHTRSRPAAGTGRPVWSGIPGTVETVAALARDCPARPHPHDPSLASTHVDHAVGPGRAGSPGYGRPGAPLRATRGTTAPNRLRRVDRWLLRTRASVLRGPARPLIVDLGFGAHPTTVVELAARVRRVHPEAEVVGVESDPARVVHARRLCGEPGVRFEVGDFDVAGVAGRPVQVLRAFNVLRQYPVADVTAAWEAMLAALAPGGLVVEGTCDEQGRLAAWVALGPAGPQSLVLAFRLAGLERPGAVAARLPKVLIEQNVPGTPVHSVLAALDDAWARAAGFAVFGNSQRLAAACEAARAAGLPLRNPRQWRHGVVEVDWAAVSP